VIAEGKSLRLKGGGCVRRFCICMETYLTQATPEQILKGTTHNDGQWDALPLQDTVCNIQLPGVSHRSSHAFSSLEEEKSE
jgi:hypothetical protein